MGDGTLAGDGEFAVIDRLVVGRTQPPSVVVGPGDDAAVLAASSATAVSTDMLVEGRHFRLDWSTPHDIGRKAIAQNASDIEAMGGRVTAFVVGYGAPGDTETAQAVALADGLWEEAARLGAGIVGGDMVAAPQWVISVTVLGELDGRPPVLRSGARPGDVVAVAGEIGWSGAGYALWHNDIQGFDALRLRHLVPAPPYGQGVVAARASATAMTDVSDGLLADLGHVAAASGVHIDLSIEALRADLDVLGPAADILGVDPRHWVLGGGEDHALVATFPGDPPPGWRPIGRVRGAAAEFGAGAVTVDGETWAGSAGWQSY